MPEERIQVVLKTALQRSRIKEVCHFKRYVIFCAFAASILLTKSSDWQQIDFGLSSLLYTVYS